MDKLTDPVTIAYLEKNRHIASLPRLTMKGFTVRPFPGRSAIYPLWLKLRRLPSVCKGIIRDLPRYNKLAALAKLKGAGKGRSALVLGNGPSQGFLDPKKLATFIENGGHLFAVNNYHNNVRLSEFSPTYMVFSDPEVLTAQAPSYCKERNQALSRYIHSRTEIVICIPFFFKLAEEFKNRIIYFNDSEGSGFLKNINPLFPRGYVSMTLYKALAIACFLDYEKIYVLGMDNTFPHDIFVDYENRVCWIERHTGESDRLLDQSCIFMKTEDFMWDLCLLFYDLKLFRHGPIVNLDPYSLTSTFPKADHDTARYFLFDQVIE